MTTQDYAILALLQLALTVTAALSVWTAWVAGYEAGWAARRELDPIYRFTQFVRRITRHIGSVAGRINDRVTAAGADLANEAERYANTETK